MRIRVKICGITDAAGLEAAVDAGADAVGFVLTASRRRVGARWAGALAQELPAEVMSVAVFHHPTGCELRAVENAFTPDLIQAEPTRDVIQAVPDDRLLPVFHDSHTLEARVGSYFELRGAAETILVEGPGRGGRGVRCDWSRAARAARRGSVILAGGLTPDGVGEAIRMVRPQGVDVSSGVETSRGVKDPGRIRAFIQAVRDAERFLEIESEAESGIPFSPPGVRRPKGSRLQGIHNG